MVSILTINYGVLGAVSIHATAVHPNDVAYTAFTQLKLTKSLVRILTSSKSFFLNMNCVALASIRGGKYTYR